MYYASGGFTIYWDEETAEYVRHRGERYPGAMGLEPEQAAEVLADIDLVVLDSDPKSRSGAMRLIGYSWSVDKILTVIAWCDEDGDLHLVNAWRSNGADLRLYYS